MSGNHSIAGLLVVASLLCGCGDDGKGRRAEAERDDLFCAAAISAVDQLMMSGTIPPSEEWQDQRALVATMTYVNGYGLNHDLSEADAMAAVKSKREELLTMATDKLVAEAKACIAAV